MLTVIYFYELRKVLPERTLIKRDTTTASIWLARICSFKKLRSS